MAAAHPDLIRGDRGPRVREVQRSLKRLGYEIAVGERRAETFGEVTEQVVRAFQHAVALDVTGAVDVRTAAVLQEKAAEVVHYVVHGTVRNAADGKPRAAARVRVADVDLRREQSIGEVKTNADGVYSLAFERVKFARDEAQGPDLVVRVVRDHYVIGEDGLRHRVTETLAQSPILFNSAGEATVDLQVGPAPLGPSEYERITAELQPLLHGIGPWDFTADDVDFLANELDYEPSWISFYARAWRYNRLVSVTASDGVVAVSDGPVFVSDGPPPVFFDAPPSALAVPTTGAPPEAYYGLFREGMPQELAELTRRDPRDLRRALEAAIRENIIPGALATRLDQIVQSLLAPAIAAPFQPANATPAIAIAGALIASAIPDQANQTLFVATYLQHKGPIAAFWTSLQGNPAFPPAVIDELQHAFWFSALTRDHLPLVLALQGLRAREQLGSVRELAAKDMAWWQTLLDPPPGSKTPVGVPLDVPGETAAERTATYVRTLMRTLELSFPTTVVGARLAADDVPQRDDLARFFANSPEFELGRDPVDAYVDAHPGAMTGVGDAAALRTRLKGIQRVFKLTPHYEEMRVLLAAGLDSARKVAATPKHQFVATHGGALGGEDRAGQLHARAERIAAAALLVFGRYSPSVNRVETHVTPRLV